jgi:hypothetical protein
MFTQHIINYLGLTPCIKGERRTPLTWKVDVLAMVANPRPLWSLAWYELPSPYFPNSTHPLPPFWPILCYNDDVNNFGLGLEHLCPTKFSLISD